MDFIELAKHRYSSRKYRAKAVETEKLKIVLEAGRIAPSANNQQPWIFVVIKEENLENLQACYPRDWFRSAPMAIVLCADHSKSWKRKDGKDHADIDVAIAADHMTLAATSINLATCWICNFDKEKLIKTINLPRQYEPVVILSLGYPEDEPNLERHDTKRKELVEIVYYETLKPL
ncbi:MAG: nitroreductase family protein [Bacteroidales bacterium]|nr:nitroreductase family protein [Bacteroidales bacterium]